MDVCAEVTECLGLDPGTVFWFERGTRQPAVAVWMAGWTPAQIKRRMKLKSNIKEIASRYGAKVYMTPMHPPEREKLERRGGGSMRSRKSRRRAYYWTRRRKYLEGLVSDWERQGGRCMWCQEPVPIKEATREHITPLSRGGSYNPENLAMSCGPCNWHRDKVSGIVIFLRLLRFRVRSGIKLALM